jgi:hypothetical protein
MPGVEIAELLRGEIIERVHAGLPLDLAGI